MKLTIFNFREWDPSNMNFIREFMSHIPDKFKLLILNIIKNPFGETGNMPAISTFMLYLNNIRYASNENDIRYVDKNIKKFIDTFVIKEVKDIRPADVLIPRFNLYHHGNICHLNVCINLLSSMYYLIEPMANFTDIGVEFDLLRKCLLNSLGPIDLNPKLIINLMQLLKIDPSDLMEADVTFKKIMNILKQKFKTNMIFFWDTTDTFLDDPEDKKLSVGDLIDKYHPKYLVVDTQDFNVILDIEVDTYTPHEFNTSNNKYVLTSMVISMPAHFISAFKVDDTNKFIVRDDLQHRFHDSFIDVLQIRNTIVLSCYVRV